MAVCMNLKDCQAYHCYSSPGQKFIITTLHHWLIWIVLKIQLHSFQHLLFCQALYTSLPCFNVVQDCMLQCRLDSYYYYIAVQVHVYFSFRVIFFLVLKFILHYNDIYYNFFKCKYGSRFLIIINPRRACAARVKVFGSCVCVCPLHFGHYE